MISFLLCIVCQNQSLYANATSVQVVETNSINAQLLYYDIEMDDYKTKTTTSVYCTCDECEAQRAKEEEPTAAENAFNLLACIFGVIVLFVVRREKLLYA